MSEARATVRCRRPPSSHDVVVVDASAVSASPNVSRSESVPCRHVIDAPSSVTVATSIRLALRTNDDVEFRHDFTAHC